MSKIRFTFLFCTLIQCVLIGQIEICDNGIDDDNDNLIDINDDDCSCTITTSTSLIPNPSFEELDCCPNDRSELYCATGWIQASAPTTDFLHDCGFSGLDQYPAPRPFPNGDGILGFRDGRISSSDSLDAYWKEYAGACLNSPLQADSAYRFQFDIGFVDQLHSPPIDVTLFGTSSCDYLPFGGGNVAFGCPTRDPNWMKLGNVRVSGGAGNRWVKEFIDFVPDVDILAFALGPSCDTIPNPDGIYYFMDNLILTDLESFDLLIQEVLHPCNDNFSLAVPANSDFEYQWYFEGIALQGEVFPEMMQNYGEGLYQVRIVSGTSCRISSPYDYVIPLFNTADTVAICQGDPFTFGEIELTKSGSYIHTFKTQNNCDSIVSLEFEVIGEHFDTLGITIAPGASFDLGGNSYKEEGEYSLSLKSSLGCDSLILLNLIHYKVFIPNAFSPNDDGVNDLFLPFNAVDEVSSYSMEIFDRWGNLVYQGDAWSGADLPPSIFVYVIKADFINGQSNTFYGSVALVR